MEVLGKIENDLLVILFSKDVGSVQRFGAVVLLKLVSRLRDRNP